MTRMRAPMCRAGYPSGVRCRPAGSRTTFLPWPTNRTDLRSAESRDRVGPRPRGDPTSPPKPSPRPPAPEPASRYTPPVPAYKKMSPPWWPATMFVPWGLGILMIILNYVGVLPGATSNWYVFGGLGLILVGIIAATQYH